MCSPSPLCVDKDIVVVVNAAAVALIVALVDHVVVLIARCGGRCHAFIVVTVRWLFLRRRRDMPLSLLPPRLSLPGGAVVARHGGRCHAFLVVVLRRQVHRRRRRRCRREMSPLSSPLRLSLSGGARSAVIPPQKNSFLWPSHHPPRTAPAGSNALTIVSAGGCTAIIYLVAWLHCMCLDCNGPSPSKN